MTKYVCQECIRDYPLQQLINREATVSTCDYCGTTSAEEAIAAPISVLMPVIREGILMEWEYAEDELFWDSEEGRYVLPTHDSYDLLEIVLDTTSQELLSDLTQELGDREWCQKNPTRLTKEAEWYLDWQNFSDQLKHHTRYVFYKIEPTARDIFEPARSPYEILDTISDLVLQQGLIKAIGMGKKIVRARAHGSAKAFSTVEELGPAPINRSRYSNRMSPAGIPMFYGSDREDTALNEVEGEKDFATVADFLTLQPFKVLDLTDLPSIPSLFDQHRNHLRPALKFLTSFTEDLSSRIEKDGREHIEYVPTQVATEYFRRVFRDSENQALRGISYPSSRHEGGVSWVLFFDAEDCTQDNRPQGERKGLSMLTASVRHVDLKNRVAPPPVGRLF